MVSRVCFESFCQKAGVRQSQVIGWRLVRWPDGVQRREMVVNDGRRFLEMPDGSVGNTAISISELKLFGVLYGSDNELDEVMYG